MALLALFSHDFGDDGQHLVGGQTKTLRRRVEPSGCGDHLRSPCQHLGRWSGDAGWVHPAGGENALSEGQIGRFRRRFRRTFDRPIFRLARTTTTTFSFFLMGMGMGRRARVRVILVVIRWVILILNFLCFSAPCNEVRISAF